MVKRRRSYHLPAIELARAALHRGPLVKAGNHYRYGERLFNSTTIAKLIASGEAVRAADRVIPAAAAER